MNNSIILPTKFENIFMIEARKSGLIHHIDMGEDFREYDEWEEKLYSKYHASRQKMFQMILLYDNIIISSADPTYEYHRLQSRADFSLYSVEDFFQYDPVHTEGHLEFAKYVKPAIIPHVIKDLKKYFVIKDKGLSYKNIASEIYDISLGIKNKMNKKIDNIINVNKFMFDLQHQDYFEKMRYLNAPSVINENRFYTDLAQTILGAYQQLCWQLEISSKKNAYIINCDYQLSKIGYDNYTKDINAYLESYKILKCECSKIIGSLPRMDNLYEVFELKEKRKNDIKNLREVLCQLEYTLKSEGKEQAIIKASNDVRKAAESLSKRNKLSLVGKWTTLCSVPIGVAELLCGLPPVGLALSAVGAGICITDEVLKKRGSWCEIVR